MISPHKLRIDSDFKKRGYPFCLLLLSFLHINAQVPQPTSDSITIAIAPAYDNVSKAHRFLLGKSYRKLWAAPVKMKVFHLKEEGLTVLQKGGGLQTKSLRLRDKKGKEWVLRSIQKYPELGLPENLRKTVAKDILQDQVVTSHPYAALTIPPLAKALGIHHSNPQIVFVADDPAFGAFRADFADSVLLFEEREPVDTSKTDNTEKAQKKLQSDNDTWVDQKLVLRARLLDLLTGDWDRHEDQWRWERKKQGNNVTYIPIPRDRDKVYYNTSGLIPWFLSHQWLKSNIQGFHEKIRDINGYNFNNRYFDRYFLTALDEEDWKEEIMFVQKTITDSLICSALKLLPDTIYALSALKIINTLIARRNSLEKEALRYYRFNSRFVDVPFSDKREHFAINYIDDGYVSVTVYKIKKDKSRDRVIYQRDFDPNITREIRLYAFGGNDIFFVNGNNRSRIKVRLIGGGNVDSFFVAGDLKNKNRLFIYDRSDEKNILPTARSAIIRTSKDSAVNKFEKRAFKYDQIGPAVAIQYNLDQGIQLRVGLVSEKHGFRKEPYAARHDFFANYSTGRKSYMLTYFADFTNMIGKNDFTIKILSRAPQNVSNFYGIGNETEFIRTEAKGISYYRNKYDVITADVRLKRNITRNFSVSTGLAAQYYGSSHANNAKKFLNDYNSSHSKEKVFTKRFFAGIGAGAEWDTRSSEMVPVKGIFWSTEIKAMQEVAGDKKSFGQIRSDFSLNLPISKDSNIVLANRVGAGTTIGKAAYFQQMQLGGASNLRGFHSIRFTGKKMFYHNMELRVKLFDFTSYLLPGTFGLIGFNDIGRVWVPGEVSKKWHHGYGGGLYIVPADLVLIQALVGHSVEGTQPYITIGLRF